jgi:ribosome biogenesis GTPase
VKLKSLGWNTVFDAAWNSNERKGSKQGRVVTQHREAWEIAGEFGECHVEASGKLRLAAESGGLWPTVGDWVLVRGEVDTGMVIDEVLPRRTQIARKVPGKGNEAQVLAANVDTVFLVMGLDGDFNLRRLERFLVQVWESGARAVALLNKADVREEAEKIAEGLRGDLVGVNVHCISARTGAGLDGLEAYLAAGETVALLGSSGAGKSTLVNRLVRSERQSTKTVRESDSRGRHTTTARELFFLASGAMVIDTPGLRELQLWEVKQGLEPVFGEVEGLAQGCRFRDCRHAGEPGCAIRQALEAGGLDAGRLESYRKLQREQEFQRRKTDRKAEQEAKSNSRKMSRAIRKLYRERETL